MHVPRRVLLDDEKKRAATRRAARRRWLRGGTESPLGGVFSELGLGFRLLSGSCHISGKF
jgi:hypothetical protein